MVVELFQSGKSDGQTNIPIDASLAWLSLKQIPEDEMLLCNSAMSISVLHMNQLFSGSSLSLLESDAGSVVLL